MNSQIQQQKPGLLVVRLFNDEEAGSHWFVQGFKLGGVVRNEGISWKLLYDCLGFEVVSQE